MAIKSPRSRKGDYLTDSQTLTNLARAVMVDDTMPQMWRETMRDKLIDIADEFLTSKDSQRKAG